MAQDDHVWQTIAQLGVHRRFIDDKLYVEGNQLCHNVLGKKSVTVFDNEDFLHENLEKFNCHIPGCQKSFETLIDFEVHYNASHRYVCSACHKRLVSPHLLDLHVSEAHDSFFAVMAEKKPMYQCYVETCLIKLSNPAERRKHCIEVHKFPADFRYDTDGKKGKSKRNTSSTSSENKSKQALPKVTNFGHGVPRGFVRGRGGLWHQQGKRGRGRPVENEVTMADLEDALPTVE